MNRAQSQLIVAGNRLLLAFGAASGVAVLGWACGGANAPSSVTATAPVATVISLSVTGAAPAVGATAQFAATATLSNASTQDVTAQATWSSSDSSIASVNAGGLVAGVAPGDVSIAATYQRVSGTARITVPKPPAPPPAPAPPVQAQCNSSLWSHVYEPSRLQIKQACITVTGVVTDFHDNEDGDVDIRLAVDPPFQNLLNNGNITNLSGHLQTEAICQTRIQQGASAAAAACKGFAGSVRVPRVGDHVQVTGRYVLDLNHGWMEIHPISALVVR